MKKLDCKGLACPAPVLETKKELESQPAGGKFSVVVDNSAARDNVIRFAESAGCKAAAKAGKGGVFTVEITKRKKKANFPAESAGKKVLFIGSEFVGRGDDKLGAILMNAMLGALAETKPLPKTIIFMNGGVKLTVKDSPVLEKLKTLETLGIEILVCGTCLDYFNLKEKLAAGKISNMFTILEKFLNAENVISV